MFYTPCARSGQAPVVSGLVPSQWPTNSCDDLLQSPFQIVRTLAPRERIDRNVICVRSSERELLRSSVGIEGRLLFDRADERGCALKREVESSDTEEQSEPVAGCTLL